MTTNSCYDHIKGHSDIFFQLEHPFSYFSKVGFPVIMSEEEIQGIYSYDPWYSIHYKNLQDETIN